MRKRFPLVTLFLLPLLCISQCEENQFEFEFVFYTSDNTQKIYWQLDSELIGDYDCNDTFLFEGGNVESGCQGYIEGTTSGYAPNSAITEGPFCLSQNYHFLHVVCGSNQITEAISLECYVNGQLQSVWENINYELYLDIDPYFQRPALDSPCSAMPILVGAAPISTNLYSIIANINEIHPPMGDCRAQGFWCDTEVNKTAWFQFDVEYGASYKVSTCGTSASANTRVAVYEAGLCDNYNSYTLLGANDNATIPCSSGGVNASEVILKCLPYSGTALVQVAVGSSYSGPVLISVEEIDPTPVVTTNVTNIRCRGFDDFSGYGKVVVNFPNLAMNEVFHWEGPNDFVSSETTIDSLAAGIYYLTIDQDCGFPLEYEFEITQPDTMMVSFTPEAPYCNGTEDGAILAEIIGGTPLTVSWFEAGQSPSFLNYGYYVDSLAPGGYRFKVIDANQCTHWIYYGLQPEYEFEFEIPAIDTICINQPFQLVLPEEYTYAFQCCYFSIKENILTIYPEQWGLGYDGFLLGTIFDQDGCSNLDSENFFIEDCSNILEGSRLEANVYPNPFQTTFHIDLNRTIVNGTLEIIDSSGREVEHEENLQGSSFELFYDLAPGFYIVNLFDELSQASFPLIKQ